MLTVLAAALLANPLLFTRVYEGDYVRGSEDDADFGYEDLPMVVESSGAFLERNYLFSNTGLYYYVLDWEAVDPEASGRFGIQQYKHMDAWRRVFPSEFDGRTLESGEFLAKYDQFLVMTNTNYTEECQAEVRGLANVFSWSGLHCPQWVARRLLDNPEWEVTDLGHMLIQAFLLRPPTLGEAEDGRGSSRRCR